MKMREVDHYGDWGYSLYPETSGERLLLDRLWEALRSANFPEWKAVSLRTDALIGYFNIMVQDRGDGRGVFSTLLTSPAEPPSAATPKNLVTLIPSPERY